MSLSQTAPRWSRSSTILIWPHNELRINGELSYSSTWLISRLGVLRRESTASKSPVRHARHILANACFAGVKPSSPSSSSSPPVVLLVTPVAVDVVVVVVVKEEDGCPFVEGGDVDENGRFSKSPSPFAEDSSSLEFECSSCCSSDMR